MNDVDNSIENITEMVQKYIRQHKIDIDAEKVITAEVLVSMMKWCFDLRITQIQCREVLNICNKKASTKEIAKTRGLTVQEIAMIDDRMIEVFCINRFSEWLSRNMVFMHKCADSRFKLPL